jgi:hypothetical protein
MERLRPLTESECYLRCYGERGSDDTVRILIPTEPVDRAGPTPAAERIRVAFEALLDSREPEAA